MSNQLPEIERRLGTLKDAKSIAVTIAQEDRLAHARRQVMEPRTFLGMAASDWQTVLIGWSFSGVIAIVGSLMARWLW